MIDCPSLWTQGISLTKKSRAPSAKILVSRKITGNPIVYALLKGDLPLKSDFKCLKIRQGGNSFDCRNSRMNGSLQ